MAANWLALLPAPGCNRPVALPQGHPTQRTTSSAPLCATSSRQQHSRPCRAQASPSGATAGTSPADADLRRRLEGLGGVVTDAAVPEGHQGLHGFLYGEEGAAVHEDDSEYTAVQGEDDGSSLVATGQWLAAREGQRPFGVYACYDSRRILQYVGYSRNMVLAVKAHLARVGDERCAAVRAMVFANKAMASRAALEREAANWLDEAGTLPPGNGVEAHLWQVERPREAMSPAEAAAYEEKKLKMRKAMGEDLGAEVAGEEPDARQRRLNLQRAVEGDDWSAVIDGQTSETVNTSGSQPSSPAEAPPPPPPPVVSPFARASVHRSIGNHLDEPEHPELTVEAVDAALDEVRPYLIADGGNVEVVGVQGKTVLLRLNGACGTCPSSTATMKMGIERSLKGTFGPNLDEVMQVDAIDTRASVASVNDHLDMLRPAIANYGGSVDVLAVANGTCEVRYTGPAPIQKGVEAALKDKFPDIKTVKFVE